MWMYIVIALLGLAIAVGGGMLSTHVGTQLTGTWGRNAWIAFGLALCAGSVAVAVLQNQVGAVDDGTPQHGLGVPSTDAGTSTDNSAGGGGGTSDEGGAGASGDVEAPAAEQDDPPATTTEPEPRLATSLNDLPSVALDTSDDIDLSVASPLEANGVTYGQALTYSCSLYCDGSSPQTREVVLGGQFERLTADLTVLDSSAGLHRVDITLDSAAPVTFAVEPGQVVPIDLDVAGVARMRVQLYAPGELKSPLQAGVDTTSGDNGGGLPGVALGDPLLLP